MPQRDDTIETLKRPAKWSAEAFGEKNPLSSYQAVCRPGTGADAFFMSILVWGVGIGCFGAAFNNFLVETYDINGFDRGVLEFLRETPGVLFVAIFAALHRFSDWKILRFGTACSLVAAVLLLVPVRWAWAVAFIVVWALGEHLIMPVLQSFAESRGAFGGEDGRRSFLRG